MQVRAFERYIPLILFFFYFTELTHSRSARKSTNKKILAICSLLFGCFSASDRPVGIKGFCIFYSTEKEL